MAVPLKICIYLDELNFYYRYSHSKKYDFKWVDICSLVTERLRSVRGLGSAAIRDAVIFFKIYTSASVDTDARARQRAYHDALQKAYPELQIIRGKHSKHKPYTEKQSDVNLAVDIVDDAHKKHYDLGVLVSGDTDFVGALRKARELQYRMVLISPPAKDKELQSMVGAKDLIISFPKEMFLRHSLANKVGYAGKPDSWNG